MVALFAFLFVVAAAGPAQAKSFSLPRVSIEAELRADGSMRVVEHITYLFDGSFSNGTRPIPRGDYEITEMSVSENGVALPIRGAPYDLAWSYSAQDEQRTFDIAYTVIGATKFGSDVGELYWKWVGDQHPGIDVLSVRLTVPGNGEGVRAWFHAGRGGEVRPGPGPVTTFDFVGLPAGRFAEGRVTVPVANFSVPPGPSPRLPGVLAEERRFIEEDARRQARDERNRRLLANAGWAFVPALGAFLFIWLRWGRDPRAARDVGEYVHEPPDDPPAVVAGLLAMGEVKPVAFSATVMDLAQRGHLTIEEVTEKRLLRDKKDWRFTRNEAPDDKLTQYESRILKRMFQEGDVTTQSELTAWAKAHPSSAQSFWEGFERSVEGELRKREYLMGGRALPFFLNIVLISVLTLATVASVASATLKGVALAGACVVTAVILGFGTLLLRSRTPAGAQRAAEWKAFGRKLRDFSQMEDAPIGHLVLWERYLVYAVALGVSAQLARALEARIPAEQRSGFAPWYVGDGGGGGFGRMGSFGDSFGSAIQSASVPSSSGSGGGSSGGGGGGGGGGGIGAS